MTEQQLDLLDAPIARRSDPITSHLAAEEITSNGRRAAQRAETLTLVCNHPGRTSYELAQIGDCDRFMLARRLPDLRKRGEVFNGKHRHCSITGRLSMTWWAVD